MGEGRAWGRGNAGGEKGAEVGEVMPARLGRNDIEGKVTPGPQVSELGGSRLPRSAIASL